MDTDQLFSGIKVLAVARVIAAPFAAYQLALQGADVITVENPDKGDSVRLSGDADTEYGKAGMSRMFLAFNSNKRSVTLRIDTPEGQDVFRDLARDADVIIENLKGGTMARYGIGYEQIHAINPGIIFCSVTGYGQTGPKKSDAAIDSAIQAGSGLMSLTGTPETGPLRTGSTIVDFATGYVSAFAIAGALFRRSRTGTGQAIDVAMLETAITLMSYDATRALNGGGVLPLTGNASNYGGYISDTYPCKEGFLMISATVENRRQRLWKAMDRADIPRDPRFASDELCRRNMQELQAEIKKTLASRTAAEWEVIMSKEGVAAMQVRSVEEGVRQAQIEQRQFFHWFEQGILPGTGPFGVPTAAYRMSDSPLKVTSKPPTLGQHTDEVLGSLGYSAERIAQLRTAGII